LGATHQLGLPQTQKPQEYLLKRVAGVGSIRQAPQQKLVQRPVVFVERNTREA
jgi:hypothetical protein